MTYHANVFSLENNDKDFLGNPGHYLDTQKNSNLQCLVSNLIQVNVFKKKFLYLDIVENSHICCTN